MNNKSSSHLSEEQLCHPTMSSLWLAKIPENSPISATALEASAFTKGFPPNTNMSGCQTNEIRDLFKSLKQVAQDLVTEADRENIFMFIFLFRHLRW